MNRQARILFVAGESGVGKSSACRAFQKSDPLLFADLITEKAGPSYFGNINEVFARWSLWTPELDKPERHACLGSAFLTSTVEVVGHARMDRPNIVIEGAITGHPQFRALMLGILERAYRIRCSDAEIAVFWLAPPATVNLEYIQKRGRPNESGVTLEDVLRRAAGYFALMNGQTYRRFESPGELTRAAVDFFEKGHSTVE